MSRVGTGSASLLPEVGLPKATSFFLVSTLYLLTYANRFPKVPEEPILCLFPPKKITRNCFQEDRMRILPFLSPHFQNRRQGGNSCSTNCPMSSESVFISCFLISVAPRSQIDSLLKMQLPEIRGPDEQHFQVAHGAAPYRSACSLTPGHRSHLLLQGDHTYLCSALRMAHLHSTLHNFLFENSPV